MTREQVDALRRVADLAQATALDAQAELDEAEGDSLRALWHRAEAEALRLGRGRERAHCAWVRHMADQHLRNGTVPGAGDLCAGEIEQTMDEMRGESAMQGM